MMGTADRDSIRVLIVDDSKLFQETLYRVLSAQPGITVVGTAGDGEAAILETKRLRPDLITMDIWMPSMDGIKAIETIMSDFPTPILVLTEDDSAGLAFKALERGALDLIRKSNILDNAGIQDLYAKIKLMGTIKVVRHMAASRKKTVSAPSIQKATSMGSAVAVAGSTGGPKALHTVLMALPKNFPAPVLVVQHIAEGFAESLADWLNQECPMHVALAKPAQRPQPGMVLLAPDHHHMSVGQDGNIVLYDGPAVDGHRPSATVLFRSIAKLYRSGAVGLILTGMGKDGAEGMRDIYAGGGVTITQDEQSSVVFGMPKAANELGVVRMKLPLDDISKALLRVMRVS